MPSKRLTTCLMTCRIVGLLALLPLPALAAGDLTTLFTTPQERQLINTNRYKSEEAKPQQPVQQDEPDQSPVQILLQEKVTVEYRISGISLSGDGMHTVWINTNAYADGEQLDDHSRIGSITKTFTATAIL